MFRMLLHASTFCFHAFAMTFKAFTIFFYFNVHNEISISIQFATEIYVSSSDISSLLSRPIFITVRFSSTDGCLFIFFCDLVQLNHRKNNFSDENSENRAFKNHFLLQ